MDTDPMVGTDFAGYAVESVLGRGAMGVVYVARQRSPERRVALKLIAPAFAGDETFRERFLREASAAAAIEHPNILPVYAAGESDGTLYLATRLVEGRDLGEILRADGALAPERGARIVTQIGAALDAAHARGLVHRDVKPGNILVARPAAGDDTDHCYLTDFGVSTWTASSAAAITQTGQLIGTANYVAPEQVEGAQVDGRTDQYALGCVLFECLTGRAPFAGRNPPATLYAHLHEEPPAPSSIRPNLPQGVDEVVARALRKAPTERYDSCRAFAQDLDEALSGARSTPATTVPHRTSAPRRSGRPGWIGVAAAALLVVGVFALSYLGFRHRGTSPKASASGPPPQLIREGVQATASRTAPASTDAAGNPVTYVPSNVVDGDVETAWRTPGNGHGATVTLIFDNPVQITKVGLIPGYAKTDPATGVNRFEQDRIIDAVVWKVPGLPDVPQTFKPVPVPQFVPLHATTLRITVRIQQTTTSGGLDYTAISEIYVYGYPQ